MALFQRRCPPAVSRFVVPVRINAVEGEMWWALSHVSEEIREGMSPVIAHGNAAPPVVLEAVRARVGTAFNHVRPNPIGIGATLAVLPQMRSTFVWAAPARLNLHEFKAVPQENMLSSAVAMTLPVGALAMNRDAFQDEQSSETQACDIDEFGHRGFSTSGVSSDGSTFAASARCAS